MSCSVALGLSSRYWCVSVKDCEPLALALKVTCSTFFGESGDWSIDGIVTDVPIRAGVWHHVACTLYPSRAASIYLDAQLIKTGPITKSVPSRPDEPLYIGSTMYFGRPVHPFGGLIDELAVYDRVLTADEIRGRYEAGLPRHRN